MKIKKLAPGQGAHVSKRLRRLIAATSGPFENRGAPPSWKRKFCASTDCKNTPRDGSNYCRPCERLNAKVVEDGTVTCSRFRTSPLGTSDTLSEVESIANALLRGLNEEAVISKIGEANSPGRSSDEVQEAVLPVAESLGFHSEKKGLFANYDVPGLRPDYFLRTPQHGTGILFEVERGKTVQNNMDLLDLWKCHICAEASILFLLVPRVLVQSDGGREQQVFAYVEKRVGTFFATGNETNVEALYLFGY